MSYTQWMDAWNDIIRNVIYQDEDFKQLMKIPEGTSIIDFIDKYFINAGYTNTVLTNQSVRVIYSDIASQEINLGVTKNELCFDIYVKNEQLHNFGNDRLRFRTKMIANKLVQMLTKSRRLYGYRFWVKGQTDVGTSAIGYTRHRISFGYLRTY